MTTAESFDLGMNVDCSFSREDKDQMIVGVNGVFCSSVKGV